MPEKKNKWFIGLKKNDGKLFDTTGFSIIESPEDTYFADPFLIEHEGIDYLFFEYYDYDKGRIAYAEIHDGKLGDINFILDNDFHMSFPSVVELFGEIYMVPEQGNSGKMSIYKAIEFPDKWEEVSSIGGVFADPILTYSNGYFRIFATNPDNHIHLFRSKNIKGPWDLYYSEDALFSRGAGNIFENDGVLIRPTQDCTPYGRAIVFREVVEGKDGRIIHTIEPDWYPNLTGTHTYNLSKNYATIDARIKLQ